MTYPIVNPIAIDFGIIKIHWYGLMYLFSFLIGYALAHRRIHQKRFPLSKEKLADFLGWIALGVIFGGRIGYMLFYQPGALIENPLSIFFIWKGGMAFHGGLIGVTLFTWYFAKKNSINPLALGDALAPLIPIGLGLGRLGNFIGGELWGRPTDLPWGIVFPSGGEVARHPSQLYECALEGLVLFCLMWWFSAKPRKPGQVIGLFLLGYGVFRFLVEFVREPDAHLGFIWLDWMTMGQVLTFPMVLIGLWLLCGWKELSLARLS